ncbi:hypothetical protein BJF82_10930 [Kytococcus sp. CUA-901]|nr:hypothetical protein BJF82_10930 [Kytococcus sp. CUA-901]
MRELITAGRLGPGEQLVEQSLVEVCGVSRNTLREGYRILADEGLVVHVPHRGVFVSAPGVAEVRDVYTARRVVECGALRERAGAGLAVAGAPPAGGDPAVVVLEQLVGRAREAAAAGRWSEVGDLNMAVHQQWVDLAGSRWLSAAAKGLLAHARLAFRTLADPGGLHSPRGEERARGGARGSGGVRRRPRTCWRGTCTARRAWSSTRCGEPAGRVSRRGQEVPTTLCSRASGGYRAPRGGPVVDAMR